MAKLKLQGKDLRKAGFTDEVAIGLAIQVFKKHFKHTSQLEALQLLKKIAAHPDQYAGDEKLRPIAEALLSVHEEGEQELSLKKEKQHFNVFGRDQIEESAMDQMYLATKLPISVAGALMPDAHSGYGLPIGGVLATDNAVIPYAVGVDIACRMSLSVFPLPEHELVAKRGQFKNILVDNTLFGSGAYFKRPNAHEVMDRDEFSDISILKGLQQKAAVQLGSSGSGNHFVEFGIVDIPEDDIDTGLKAGRYIGLLSHSGSRALGANIAKYFTDIAIRKTRLPQSVKHMAWLDLNSDEGMQYWLAMNFAGEYAAACHDVIHARIAREMGVKPLLRIENHHNFAWKEMHNGKEVIVHRKGATPAAKGVLGIIPGSMAEPGFIVRGKGEEASINSAAHGAGRLMSRNVAKRSFSQHGLEEQLKQKGITLVGGGLDEAPGAYKDIHSVMKAQKALVDVLGTFQPKIVRMDGR
jgi:tRNA-splicing ligase RtcB